MTFSILITYRHATTLELESFNVADFIREKNLVRK